MKVNTKSVRFRTTVGAALALGVLVALSGVMINWIVTREVQRAADSVLLEQARDRAVLLDAGADPMSLDDTVVGDEVVVAVIGSDGAVITASGTSTPGDLVGLPIGLTDVRLAIFERDEGDAGGGEPHFDRIRVAVAVASGGSQVIVGNEGEQARKTINTVRTVLLAGTPLVAAAGAVIVWIVTGRALAPTMRMRGDLDEIVNLAGSKRLTEPGTGDEIDALAVTMNEVLDRLEQESEARRRFVADASHELKSPVANARVLIETADAALSPAEKQLRAGVLGELDRLQALVDDLLYLARTDETTQHRSDIVDLDDVVFDEAERVALRTDKAINAAGVQPAQVVGDRSDVSRAIRNLLENAVRHARTEVVVAIEIDDQWWVVVVGDDGPGIPLPDRDRIFQRFARLDEQRSRGDGGTGLGLSIVATIAARHRGSVQVVDQRGGGARLELRFRAAT